MGDYTDILYCCATDYFCEPKKDIKWFEELDNLKDKRTCWNECGIIKVVVDYKGDELYKTWVEPGKYQK